MGNLKTRIEQLEKGGISGGLLIIYDGGEKSEGGEPAISRVEARGRVVVRVSPIDAAL